MTQSVCRSICRIGKERTYVDCLRVYSRKGHWMMCAEADYVRATFVAQFSSKKIGEEKLDEDEKTKVSSSKVNKRTHVQRTFPFILSHLNVNRCSANLLCQNGIEAAATKKRMKEKVSFRRLIHHFRFHRIFFVLCRSQPRTSHLSRLMLMNNTIRVSRGIKHFISNAFHPEFLLISARFVRVNKMRAISVANRGRSWLWRETGGKCHIYLMANSSYYYTFFYCTTSNRLIKSIKNDTNMKRMVTLNVP